jgi:hypothetical protein
MFSSKGDREVHLLDSLSIFGLVGTREFSLEAVVCRIIVLLCFAVENFGEVIYSI